MSPVADDDPLHARIAISMVPWYAATADDTPTPPPKAGDMTALFNGEDLTGWDGDPRLWGG